LIKFDCYDFARIRFHYHWYAMTGKCFQGDTCYDTVSFDCFQVKDNDFVPLMKTLRSNNLRARIGNEPES
jgi:hypothetical protein